MTDNQRPTYIDFLLSFNNKLSQDYYTANEQLLYHTLLMINNACFWTEWFYRTDEQLTGILKIGISAMKTARNGLKQKGAIDFKSSKIRGTCTQYKICDGFCTYQIKQQMFDRCITDDFQIIDNSTTDDIPYKNKTEIKTKTKTKSNITPNPFKGELAKKFDEWLAYKKERGQAYKPTGLNALIAKIQKAINDYGEHRVISAIDDSISNNWQGLFFDRTSKSSNEQDLDIYHASYDYDAIADEIQKQRFAEQD